MALQLEKHSASLRISLISFPLFFFSNQTFFYDGEIELPFRFSWKRNDVTSSETEIYRGNGWR